jgi:Bacterial protein of unknown function (DUF937)
MGVFFELLSAINNPEQKANVNQLSQVTNTIQQLTKSNGIDPAMAESIMSVVGENLRSAMQQQGDSPRDRGGSSQLSNLIGQVAGGNNPLSGAIGSLGGGNLGVGAIQSMIPPQIQQQMIEGLVKKTGLSANVAQSILPALLPAVFNLLQMGASKSGTQGANNPVLNAFLDSNNSGGADLGDVLKFANRFLNPPK